MAISANTIAYGAVVVVGLVLFAVGTPAERAAAPGTSSPPAVPAYSVALNARLAAYAAATGPHAPPAAAEGGGIRLRSVGFDFPTSDRGFPGGATADIVMNNCTACHSPSMILTQPSLTRGEWKGEVDKMLHTYKATVSAEDVDGIVTYLASMKPAP